MLAKQKKGSEQDIFTELRAKKFLEKSLPIIKDDFFSLKECENLLKNKKEEQKFPIVLKIAANSVLHKTEISGVRIAYNSEQFFQELSGLLKVSEKLKAQGILVEEFILGQEIIIGLKKDRTFGHVIGLGLGGIFVEVLKNIVFRKCPINETDFESMIKELKIKELFERKKINLELLKDAVLQVSRLPEKYPKILELDINPFIINDKDGKVVDARIVFEK